LVAVVEIAGGSGGFFQLLTSSREEIGRDRQLIGMLTTSWDREMLIRTENPNVKKEKEEALAEKSPATKVQHCQALAWLGVANVSV